MDHEQVWYQTAGTTNARLITGRTDRDPVVICGVREDGTAPRERHMRLLISGLASAALLTIASTSSAQFVPRGAQTGVLPQAQRTEARCWAEVRQLVTRWAMPQTSNDQQQRQITQIGSTLGCSQVEQQHSQPPYR